MPSELIVKVETIKEINEHPNADRLELATVKGWQCVVQKGAYKVGDKIVYLPIDSILPHDLEARLFPPDAKIKLHKSRIRTINIRKAISQGMIISLEEAEVHENTKVGTDVREVLGITKYKPPAGKQPRITSGRPTKQKHKNSHFKKYTHIAHFKNYPDVLVSDEETDYIPVVVTEKIHGTNFRCGWVPREADVWWKKIWFKVQDALGIGSAYEWVYGSHNEQLQSFWKRRTGFLKLRAKVFYATNVYYKTVQKYELKKLLKPGEVLYGEIYGDGIQKNYTYGCGNQEQRLVVFDIMKDGQYMDFSDLDSRVNKMGLTLVPILHIGTVTKEQLEELVQGTSILCQDQKVREGIVVRPTRETRFYGGRSIFKFINPKYLLKDQSEWS